MYQLWKTYIMLHNFFYYLFINYVNYIFFKVTNKANIIGLFSYYKSVLKSLK